MDMVNKKYIQITRIGPQTLDDIRPLWEALNQHHAKQSSYFKDHFATFTFKERKAQIQNKEKWAVFGVFDGRPDPVGYCIASSEGKTGEIDSIFIDPEHRGKDFGERLISHAEAWLESIGVETIRVSVAQGNEPVFYFYNKQGYFPRFTVLEKKNEND